MMEQQTILVVDDEPEITSLYEAWLEQSYAVKSAVGGDDALAAVDDDVDAVLLDRQMPDVSGDEVALELRSRGLDCPVGLVTAEEPTVNVFDLPFEQYLLKPVDRGEIRECVARLLSLADLDDPSRRYARARSTAAAVTDGVAAAPGERREVIERCRRVFERASGRTELTVEETLDECVSPLRQPCDGN